MGFDDRDGVIWMDGDMVQWRDAKVHVLTHTLHYGVGAFEGIRAYNTERGTAVFRLHEHVRRLFETAHILQMKMPYTPEVIARACIDCVRENGLETAYIRPLVFWGSEAMGLHATALETHVAIAAWFWGAYLGADALEKGIRVKTSSFPRALVSSKAKACGNYIASIMAHQEAAAAGYDEALQLDGEGLVAEGSGENLFICRDGVIYTPELTAALVGITRATVMTLAAEAGYEVREKRITRDEIYIADEAFFTGTAAEVTPVRELDDRRIGSGEPGPITRALQSQYLDVVQGRVSAHHDWLTLLE